MRLLFSEGSSLTAREFLSVLGPAGHHIEIVDPNPTCICRFSRWTKRVHLCPQPGIDPLGYLEAVNRLLADDAFDLLLPTHEQAWLFAAYRERIRPNTRVAIASAAAFSQVQSKIAFARLLDEVGLPQPKWKVIDTPDQLIGWEKPFFLKAPFSTAGMGVRRVTNAGDAKAAFESLRSATNGGPLMVQAAANGEYAQVQALFDRGRLFAVHTSAQTAVGIGPSAAGRVGVDHPFARRDMAMLGERLNWHGGLTLDYLFRDGEYVYIECNPRTVEPANAAASGVNLPELQIALSCGKYFDGLLVGRPGIRTHSALAIVLGTAAYAQTRKSVLAEVIRLFLHRGPYHHSRESLTPVMRDFPSAIPLATVLTRALLSPRSAERLAHAAVRAYSMAPDSIGRI
jgi:carbamoylphosphate synthase large subunit